MDRWVGGDGSVVDVVLLLCRGSITSPYGSMVGSLFWSILVVVLKW